MDLQEAEKLARELMHEHKLNFDCWIFQWDNAKKRFGYCNYREKVISISAPLTLLNSADHFKDTVLHEIAHALAPSGAGHNHRWKYIALAIGCNGKRCYDGDVVIPKMKYTTLCPNCGKQGQRNRQGRATACGRCCRQHNGGRYTEKYLLTYTKN